MGISSYRCISIIVLSAYHCSQIGVTTCYNHNNPHTTTTMTKAIGILSDGTGVMPIYNAL